MSPLERLIVVLGWANSVILMALPAVIKVGPKWYTLLVLIAGMFSLASRFFEGRVVS